jgi:hypothetical protein
MHLMNAESAVSSDTMFVAAAQPERYVPAQADGIGAC